MRAILTRRAAKKINIHTYRILRRNLDNSMTTDALIDLACDIHAARLIIRFALKRKPWCVKVVLSRKTNITEDRLC